MNIGHGLLNLDTYFTVAVDRLRYRRLGCREATDQTCDRPLNQFISATGDPAGLYNEAFMISSKVRP
jgi:hypothetical protein